MDFVNATLPLVHFFDETLDLFQSVRANKLDSDAPLPALMIKQVNRTTIQIIVRSDDDIEAMNLCEFIGNDIKRNFDRVKGINIFDIDFQTTPTPDLDEETDKPECWCYLDIKYFEN
ncbi:putative uncharacterized protein [Tetragenococcus halophilus subsp. halophilus]|uniref:hypothetical protein n=1 Tax=Tetragenococcus halophilus TaxID=51669 RepID=UPI000CB1A5C7|nr:hypothetical protein [Tetragenococcus halophilus]GBD73723.1 putative uncharacterized protein [Tetragenococcus halophilus subsp. halophilus]GBD76433.1 putative uncharacterized protein [Tetragenococcus halophilus subsp. halophilus]